MVLVGHSKHQATPLTKGQRTALRSVGAILTITAVIVVVWLSVGNTGIAVSGHGCVSVIVAGATGGNVLRECGGAARSWCKSEFSRHDALAVRIEQQCRVAGVKPPVAGTSGSSGSP
jgi:hypothetical protein